MDANSLRVVLKAIAQGNGEDAMIKVGLTNGHRIEGTYSYPSGNANLGILEMVAIGTTIRTFIDVDSIIWVSTPAQLPSGFEE